MTDPIKQALELLRPISHNSTDDPRGLAYAAIAALEGMEKAEPVAVHESLCANCGKPANQAKECLSDYPEEGEWFCSHECKDLHDELGCPHEHHHGYRHPAEAKRLIDCENALRSLACWLGVGGYNAPTIDAKMFEEKIRSGVQYFTHPAPVQAEPSGWKLVPVEPTQEMHDAARAALAGGSVPMPKVYRAMLNAAPKPAAQVVGLADAEILAIASDPTHCPVAPWWLKDDVLLKDIRSAAVSFARAIEAAHGIKPPEKGGAV